MCPTAMHVSLDACTIIGIFDTIKATAEVRINRYTSSPFIFGRRALGLYACSIPMEGREAEGMAMNIA